ncbi:MAG TPA: hypothetical protein VGF99_06495, partial [Myxococcota bacterium]
RCVTGGGVDGSEASVSTFYIDDAALSVDDYQRCVDDKSCTPLKNKKLASLDFAQAQAYCVFVGKRLPTEWEWQKAVPASSTPEWTSTWFASLPSCGERCRGLDPLGPCDGASPCSGNTGLRTIKGLPSGPAGRKGAALAGVPKIGARCASSTTTLATWPPKQIAKPNPPPKTPTPPTAEQLAIFSDVKEDTLAKQVCEKKGRSFVDCRDPNHYIKSNEPRQYVWRPYIENLGGGYVGVGIDQNYSFIAHAKSEWVWLFDYDPTVVRLHHVLRAVILDSKDRESFVAHFTPEMKEHTLALLSSTYKGLAERAAYREIYGVSRAGLHKYYGHQMAGEIAIADITKVPGSEDETPYRTAGVKIGEDLPDPSYGWLATEEAYQYIRLLYQQGRVELLKGDMLAKNTMQGIAASAKKLGVTVRIFYPSNAPECWPHTAQYKSNVRALPFDEQSVVIQSLSGVKAGFGKQKGYWHYNVQSGLQQQELMTHKGYVSLKQLVGARHKSPDPDLTTSGLAGVGN